MVDSRRAPTQLPESLRVSPSKPEAIEVPVVGERSGVKKQSPRSSAFLFMAESKKSQLRHVLLLPRCGQNHAHSTAGPKRRQPVAPAAVWPVGAGDGGAEQERGPPWKFSRPLLVSWGCTVPGSLNSDFSPRNNLIKYSENLAYGKSRRSTWDSAKSFVVFFLGSRPPKRPYGTREWGFLTM